MASTGVELPPDILKDKPEAALRRLYSYLYTSAEDINNALHVRDTGSLNQAISVLNELRKTAADLQSSSVARTARTVTQLQAELRSLRGQVSALQQDLSDLEIETARDIAQAVTDTQNALHPVGSLYLSMDANPPSFGQWVQISNGQYLAAGNPASSPETVSTDSVPAGDISITAMFVAVYQRIS